MGKTRKYNFLLQLIFAYFALSQLKFAMFNAVIRFFLMIASNACHIKLLRWPNDFVELNVIVKIRRVLADYAFILDLIVQYHSFFSLVNYDEATLLEHICLFVFSEDLVEDDIEIPLQPQHLNDVHLFGQCLARLIQGVLIFITLATDVFLR